MEDALKISPRDDGEARPAFELLAVGLAWRLAGNIAEAEAWEARAAGALESGDADEARAAVLLRRPTPPAPAELAEVAVIPQWKSLLLADLAQRHPARQAELGAAARRLNIMRSFPYHLVERAAKQR